MPGARLHYRTDRHQRHTVSKTEVGSSACEDSLYEDQRSPCLGSPSIYGRHGILVSPQAKDLCHKLGTLLSYCWPLLRVSGGWP